MLERVKIRENFVLQSGAIADDKKSYLFDVIDGNCFELNEISHFILDSIQKNCDLKGVLHAMLQEFDVDEEQAQSDLRSFVQQCIDDGILEEVSEDKSCAV